MASSQADDAVVSARPAEQVSCQALQVFFEFVESRGMERSVLDHGLKYPPDWFAGRGNWVDYDTLVTIEERIAALFPDEHDLFFQAGYSIGQTSGLGFLRTISRTLISPFQVYLRLPGMMKRFMFRFFSVQYVRTSRSSVRGTYQFDADCPPTTAFLDMARGVLSGLPLMLGAPAAEVRVDRPSELEVVINVRFVRWLGPVGYVRSLIDGVRRWLTLRLQAPEEAADELEETNRLLQEKVDALQAAKLELDQRVTDLADLRDNLALRVRERTAELEIAGSRLEDTVVRLEEADRARSDFFTNVSHEFKTPLTLILASVDEMEQMADEVPSAPWGVHLPTMRRNGVALLRLITEILDSSRLSAGAMDVNLVPCDLAAVFTDALEPMQAMAELRGIRLHPLRADGPIETHADATMLVRALLNLVVNAIKYCDTGDAVRVRLSQGDSGVRIEVVDTGPGIPQDQQDGVFERFQRCVDGRGRAIEGSGIGLAMVRDIVLSHGGAIDLISPPGGGCNFRIQLPPNASSADAEAESPIAPKANPAATELLESAVAAISPGQQADPATLAEAPASDRGTILVVDDNDDMRAFLARTIGRQHRVLLAADGAQGLELANAELPDLVLSDVMMPVIDGLELCRRLKAEAATRNIPVILITARHGPEGAVEGLAAGADDYVLKPFSPQELRARIATQLRIRQLTATLIRAEKQGLLGIMSSGIAHEVLNPVNAVVNSAPLVGRFLEALPDDTLAGGLDAPSCRQLTASVEEAGRRIEMSCAPSSPSAAAARMSSPCARPGHRKASNRCSSSSAIGCAWATRWSASIAGTSHSAVTPTCSIRRWPTC